MKARSDRTAIEASAAPLPAPLALEALAIAALLVASQWAIIALYGGRTGSDLATIADVLPLLALLGLPMLLLLRLARAIDHTPASTVAVAAMILVGALMRLPYFGAPPVLEDDHYRYLLDGAMLAHGFNPYGHAPVALIGPGAPVEASVLLSGAGDTARETIAKVNFPDLRTIYPGTAQLAFALAYLLSPWSLDGLRIVMAGGEAATLALLLLFLRRLGRSPLWAGLFWLSPLMAFTLTGQAHVDALLPPMVLGALLLAASGRGAAAGLVLALGMGVKFWPVLLAPLLVVQLWPDRRAVARFAVAASLGAGALCLPVIVESLQPASGLAAYARGWSVNNAPYAWVSWWGYVLLGEGTGERVLRLSLAVAAAAVALGAAWRVARTRDASLHAVAAAALVVTATLFYLSPAQFPWYVVWMLPLAALLGHRALLLAAATMPIYFLFFPLAAAGLRDWHNYGIAALHLLPVLVALYLSRRSSDGAS